MTPTPENLLISGLSGNSYVDDAGTANGAEQFYMVRAVEQFTQRTDGNAVVRSATPSGPNSGVSDLYFEDFSSASTFDNDWTVTTGPAAHNCGAWDVRTGTGSPSGGSGAFAAVVSDAGVAGDCSFLPLTSSTATSPVIDLDVTGFVNSISLSMDIFFNDTDDDVDASIEFFNGSVWVPLWTAPNSDVNTTLTFDLQSQVGNSQYQLRFDYQGGNDAGWLSVDDIRITADIDNACLTGATGPAPAPDGFGSTDPLLSDRVTVDGSTLDVSWDASCGSTDYNLIFGDLQTSPATPSRARSAAWGRAVPSPGRTYRPAASTS